MFSANGYTLIGEGGLNSVFESKGRDHLEAFKGTLVFKSYYEDFNLESQAYRDACPPTSTDCFYPKVSEKSYFMFYDAVSVFFDSLSRILIYKQTITPEKLLKFMTRRLATTWM